MLLFLRRCLVFLLVLALSVGFATAIRFTGGATAYEFLGGSWSSIDPLKFCISTSYGNDYYRWLDALYYWRETDTEFDYTTTCSGNDAGLVDLDDSGLGWDGAYALIGDDPYESGLAWLNYHYVENYNVYKINSVSGHEVGHLLGLDHEEGPKLMDNATCGSTSRYCTYDVWTPQTDDINGINALY